MHVIVFAEDEYGEGIELWAGDLNAPPSVGHTLWLNPQVAPTPDVGPDAREGQYRVTDVQWSMALAHVPTATVPERLDAALYDVQVMVESVRDA